MWYLRLKLGAQASYPFGEPGIGAKAFGHNLRIGKVVAFGTVPRQSVIDDETPGLHAK